MKILLALNSLGIGGTESYVLTVAEHLDRLAHEAAVYAGEAGPGVEAARERGVKVVGTADLDSDFDAALVQDAAASLEVADLLPKTPQIFVGHSEFFDPQLPPQVPDVVQVAIALNDRVVRRIASLDVELDVMRLRQPIDTERFVSRGPLPEAPRRALMLSNNLSSDRMAMLESACATAGLELTRVGGSAGQVIDPRPALAGADVVIGLGRSILEAMACGRAAYVYDWSGGDGWVTPESYPSIEAGGFGGRAEPVIDGERLSEDLRRYSSSMGPVNRDLVLANHRANIHVQEIVELARKVAPPRRRPRAPLDEMARLVRQEWRARSEVYALLGENASLRTEVEDLRSRLNGPLANQNAREVARGYEESRSWRITSPLRAFSSLLKRPFRARRPKSDNPSPGR